MKRYCRHFMCNEYVYKNNKYCHECNIRKTAIGVIILIIIALVTYLANI